MESKEKRECNCSSRETEKGFLFKFAPAFCFFLAAFTVSFLPFGFLDNEALTSISYKKLLSYLLYFISFIIASRDVMKEAVLSLCKGEIGSEAVLMSVASVGAICLGEIVEAVAIMLFFTLGEAMEEAANKRTRTSLSSLLRTKVSKALLLHEKDGFITEEEVDVSLVKAGDIVRVKTGGEVPCDGIIVRGHAFLNTASLTGEEAAREALVGDEVFSAYINTNGVIDVKVTKSAAKSAKAALASLLEEAAEKKARIEGFLSRFSLFYTPAVLVLSVLTAAAVYIFTRSFHQSFYRALIFLVVSCPCALVISVPLSFCVALGKAFRSGVLVKSSSALENFARLSAFAFDKTGTLTKGVFSVQALHPVLTEDISKADLSRIASHAERFSSHPVAKPLADFHHGECCFAVEASGIEEIAGRGIKLILNKRRVLAGNETLMRENSINVDMQCIAQDSGTFVHVATDGEYMGHILIGDEVKPSSRAALEELRSLGVKRLLLLTGDNEKSAAKVASALGIEELYTSLLPQDKLRILQKLGEEVHKKRRTFAFAGDGINDSPSLAQADVGVAMGAIGQDAALAASDVVVMSDELEKLPFLVRLSRKAKLVIVENISFALFVKFLVMALGAVGITNMWPAVFADVGVTIITLLNALRVGTVK